MTERLDTVLEDFNHTKSCQLFINTGILPIHDR